MNTDATDGPITLDDVRAAIEAIQAYPAPPKRIQLTTAEIRRFRRFTPVGQITFIAYRGVPVEEAHPLEILFRGRMVD